MEPKYLAFRRWLNTPIIIWQDDWIPRLCTYQQSALSIWMFPKIGGTPKSSILIGFSIIFTIHLGVFPLFSETPKFLPAGPGKNPRNSGLEAFRPQRSPQPPALRWEFCLEELNYKMGPPKPTISGWKSLVIPMKTTMVDFPFPSWDWFTTACLEDHPS